MTKIVKISNLNCSKPSKNKIAQQQWVVFLVSSLTVFTAKLKCELFYLVLMQLEKQQFSTNSNWVKYFLQFLQLDLTLKLLNTRILILQCGMLVVKIK